MSAQFTRLELATMSSRHLVDNDWDFDNTPPKKAVPKSQVQPQPKRMNLNESWYGWQEVMDFMSMAQDALLSKTHASQLLMHEAQQAQSELQAEREHNRLMSKADEDSGCLREEIENLLQKNHELKANHLTLEREYNILLIEHYVTLQEHKELQDKNRELQAQNLELQKRLESTSKKHSLLQKCAGSDAALSEVTNVVDNTKLVESELGCTCLHQDAATGSWDVCSPRANWKQAGEWSGEGQDSTSLGNSGSLLDNWLQNSLQELNLEGEHA